MTVLDEALKAAEVWLAGGRGRRIEFTLENRAVTVRCWIDHPGAASFVEGSGPTFRDALRDALQAA